MEEGSAVMPLPLPGGLEGPLQQAVDLIEKKPGMPGFPV